MRSSLTVFAPFSDDSIVMLLSFGDLTLAPADQVVILSGQVAPLKAQLAAYEQLKREHDAQRSQVCVSSFLPCSFVICSSSVVVLLASVICPNFAHRSSCDAGACLVLL